MTFPTPTEKGRNMQIKILNDGTYNDAENKAQQVKAGELFETSNMYGALLIADGLAEVVGDQVVETLKIDQGRIVSTMDDSLDGKKNVTKKRSRGKKNEFLK